MLELFTTFSISQIIVFTITLALAIKGCVDFFDWCKNKYQAKFDKDHTKLNKEQALEEHYIRCSEQHKESMRLYSNVENKIDKMNQSINNRFDAIEESIDTLKQSDMHDIKSWIVEKHHILMENGWVDDFTMDTLEKRFLDYVKEGGNTYVEKLMNEIRALPHKNPMGGI